MKIARDEIGPRLTPPAAWIQRVSISTPKIVHENLTTKRTGEQFVEMANDGGNLTSSDATKA